MLLLRFAVWVGWREAGAPRLGFGFVVGVFSWVMCRGSGIVDAVYVEAEMANLE